MKSLGNVLCRSASCSLALSLPLLALAPGCEAVSAAPAPEGLAWSSWRGPQQNGTSLESDLPDRWTADGENQLWTYDLAGRGTPAIADGRVYALGYAGEGPDLREFLVCLDERDGRLIWERRFNDFLSDSVYSRYAIGAPTIDPLTGNVFCLTTPGLLSCFTGDGDLLWQHSMMEEFGRLTFPNGRTGAPVVDGDLVIARGITADWGAEGPARDRFYAFETDTGRLVWSSTPGTAPKDSSFSHPVLGDRNGRRVLYAGTGCGHVVAIDARTGAPIWRFPMSIGGVNSAVVLGSERLFAMHGRENLDSSTIGRMVAIDLRAADDASADDRTPAVLGADQEIWRNDLGAFTSSPVMVGDRLYVTVHTGDLCCIDTKTGRILWHEKLAPDQIHASPTFGDGKLYVPMTNGSFYIIEPSDDGAEILAHTELGGSCLGAPAIAGGRVYVHTTEKLYCFGRAGGYTPAAAIESRPRVAATAPRRLMCAPSEVLLRPGESVALKLRHVDDRGRTVPGSVESGSVESGSVDALTWTIPPDLALTVNNGAVLSAASNAPTAAGVIKAESAAGTAGVRVRIVPTLPMLADFESTTPAIPHKTEPGVKFAFPPSSWIGAKLKWEVRETGDGNVLAKTLDRALFQRSMSFIGDPDLHDYTTQVDIMSDGNRRSMSSAGMINQRYMIVLKGNHQEIEISSNQERIKESVPFRWRPNVWYTLKSRVDTRDDGSTLVRAKAWRRGEPEPAAWSIEFAHTNGHAHGAPGLFGFTPQSRFRVYVDNIMVTANE